MAVNFDDGKIQVYHPSWSILPTNEAWKHASTPRAPRFNSSSQCLPCSTPPRSSPPRLHIYLHKMINIMPWKIAEQTLSANPLCSRNVIYRTHNVAVWTALIRARPQQKSRDLQGVYFIRCPLWTSSKLYIAIHPAKQNYQVSFEVATKLTTWGLLRIFNQEELLFLSY